MLSSSDLERLIAAKRIEIENEKKSFGLTKSAEQQSSEPNNVKKVCLIEPGPSRVLNNVPARPDKENIKQSTQSPPELPPHMVRYIRRYTGLPVMLKTGEYSPNNPLLRTQREDKNGDVFLGLGEYEERKKRLRKIRQQEYKDYLDKQAKLQQQQKLEAKRYFDNAPNDSPKYESPTQRSPDHENRKYGRQNYESPPYESPKPHGRHHDSQNHESQYQESLTPKSRHAESQQYESRGPEIQRYERPRHHDSQNNESLDEITQMLKSRNAESQEYESQIEGIKKYERPRHHDSQNHESSGEGSQMHKDRHLESQEYESRGHEIKQYERPRHHDSQNHESLGEGSQIHKNRNVESQEYKSRGHEIKNYERPRHRDSQNHESLGEGSQTHKNRCAESQEYESRRGEIKKYERPRHHDSQNHESPDHESQRYKIRHPESQEYESRGQSNNRADFGAQCSVTEKPSSVAVQTDDLEVVSLSTRSPHKIASITQAERELSPRTVIENARNYDDRPIKTNHRFKNIDQESVTNYQAEDLKSRRSYERPKRDNGEIRRRSYGDFQTQETPVLTRNASRDRLLSDLRHTHMPSLYDSEVIKLRNIQSEQEASERKLFYQQELKKQIMEQQRIREERKAREKMLEAAEMRRLEEQLRMLRLAQESEQDKQSRLTCVMNENAQEYERRRKSLQKEIDIEKQNTIKAKTTKKREPLTSRNDTILPTHFPFNTNTTRQNSLPYSTNIPKDSIFSPTYDVDCQLRKNLNPSKASEYNKNPVKGYRDSEYQEKFDLDRTKILSKNTDFSTKAGLRKNCEQNNLELPFLVKNVDDNVSIDSLHIPILRHSPITTVADIHYNKNLEIRSKNGEFRSTNGEFRSTNGEFRSKNGEHETGTKTKENGNFHSPVLDGDGEYLKYNNLNAVKSYHSFTKNLNKNTTLKNPEFAAEVDDLRIKNVRFPFPNSAFSSKNDDENGEFGFENSVYDALNGGFGAKNSEVGAKNNDISEKMKIVEQKWKVPVVQKNIVKPLPSSDGKNKSILTQLGSIRRQLQMEQLKLDKMLAKDN